MWSAPPCSTGGAVRLVRAGRHACWAGVLRPTTQESLLIGTAAGLVAWHSAVAACVVAARMAADSLRLQTTILVELEVLRISRLCFASLLCYAHECVGLVTVCSFTLFPGRHTASRAAVASSATVQTSARLGACLLQSPNTQPGSLECHSATPASCHAVHAQRTASQCEHGVATTVKQ